MYLAEERRNIRNICGVGDSTTFCKIFILYLVEECKIPVGFLIDETCSLSEMASSITELGKLLVTKMQTMESKISNYVLTTVNDKSYKIERNVFFKLKTGSAHNFMEELDKIKSVKCVHVCVCVCVYVL